MKFVELHHYGRPIYVNPEHVVTMEPVYASGDVSGTLLHFLLDSERHLHTVRVEEDPTTIIVKFTEE